MFFSDEFLAFTPLNDRYLQGFGVVVVIEYHSNPIEAYFKDYLEFAANLRDLSSFIFLVFNSSRFFLAKSV